MNGNYNQPKQNNSSIKIIIAAVVIVFVIIAAVGSFLVVRHIQQEKEASSASAVENQIDNIIEYADALASKGDYDGAIAAIDSGLINHPDSRELLEKKLEYTKLKDSQNNKSEKTEKQSTSSKSTYTTKEYNDSYDTTSNSATTPFYAICCAASKDYSTANKSAQEMQEQGFNAFVITTTDWSNLNKEKWYVVTAGRYDSKSDANAALKSVKKAYSGAYVKYTGSYKGSSGTTVKSAPSGDYAFYGIWCAASKSESSAEKEAQKMRDNGFDASVVVTTDWSNLNKEKWYVVTAGKYDSKSDANAALKSVKKIYKDAYVKYSGEYIG